VVWLVQAWQIGSPNWQNWVVVATFNATLTCVLILLAVRYVRHAALRPVLVCSGRFRLRLLRVRPGIWQWGILWKELFTECSVKGLGSATRTLMAFIGWGAFLWMIWALVNSPVLRWPAHARRFKSSLSSSSHPFSALGY